MRPGPPPNVSHQDEAHRSQAGEITLGGVANGAHHRKDASGQREGGNLWALVSEAVISGGPVDFEIVSYACR